jgi:SAM-dependent methyltransferase
VSEAPPSEWAGFILDEFSFTDFPPGARVLDVGCGEGAQLRLLREAGCGAVGVEPAASTVSRLVAAGLDVRQGTAEHLPVEDRSFDGVVCKAVLPYTDERRAIAEWSRVLRPGGRVRATYHGAGYYLRYLLEGPALPNRVYAARSLANGWWYALTGRRIPGWLGDTLYQSRARLARYYRRFGFALEREWPAPTFHGKPVFIYHELRRLEGDAEPPAGRVRPR